MTPNNAFQGSNDIQKALPSHIPLVSHKAGGLGWRMEGRREALRYCATSPRAKCGPRTRFKPTVGIDLIQHNGQVLEINGFECQPKRHLTIIRAKNRKSLKYNALRQNETLHTVCYRKLGYSLPLKGRTSRTKEDAISAPGLGGGVRWFHGDQTPNVARRRCNAGAEKASPHHRGRGYRWGPISSSSNSHEKFFTSEQGGRR